MHLLLDRQALQRVNQEVERRRLERYQRDRRSTRGRRNWLVRRRIRAARAGSTSLSDPYDLADIVLDDGTYLDEVLCYGESAVGIVVGGHTGVVEFADCADVKGRQVTHALKWRWWHRIPVVGDLVRSRWASRCGVVPVRPSWVPRI